MVGGEDVAVRRNDDAGAEALLLAGALTVIALELVAEKLPEERVIHQRVKAGLLMNNPRGVDVDDAGLRLFHHRCEAGTHAGLAVYRGLVHTNIRAVFPRPDLVMHEQSQGQGADKRRRNAEDGFVGQFHMKN